MLSLQLISLVVSSYGFRPIHHTVGSLRGSRRVGATSLRAAISEVQKPVILLDVDGVINMQNGRISYSGRKNTPMINAKKHWKDARNKSIVLYSPTVVEKINAWSELAEMKWLTAWGAQAPEWLAPKLGLNAFPYLPYVHHGDIDLPDKPYFAQQVVDEIGPDRLIIWLDDDMDVWVPARALDGNGFDQPYDSYQYRATKATADVSVLVRPNTLYVGPWCGLTPKHLDLVDKYLADPSLVAGKAIY